MRRAPSLVPWCAAVAAGLAAVAFACSSSSPRPAELGDCTPTNDAGCTPPSSSGGKPGGPGDGGGGQDTGVADVGTASCTGAATTFAAATSNPQCVPCVETPSPNGCCDTYAACTQDTDCIPLLACILSGGDGGLPCNPGDPTCAANCENQYPSAVSSYDTLAQCVSGLCPYCPPLPQ